jgi:uncharacterized membrane protein
VEQVIGNLLRIGILISAVVVFVGGVLYLAQEGQRPMTEHNGFHQEANQKLQPLRILSDAMHGSSEGIIGLGLLMLILTPIARVLFCVIAFALQRDRNYVLISLLVFLILVYSLFSGHIH